VLPSLCLFYHFFSLLSAWLEPLYHQRRLKLFSYFLGLSQSLLKDLLLSHLLEFFWQLLNVNILFKLFAKFKSLVAFIGFRKLEKDSSLGALKYFIIEFIVIHASTGMSNLLKSKRSEEMFLFIN
jgi:hypothetical protein